MAYPRSPVPPCEAVPALDVRPLWRNGQLRPGRSSVITWAADGEPVAGIRLEAWANAVDLVFKTPAGETVRQNITLTFTACHFGNQRPWFECPQCRRRSGVLYVVAVPAFSCRKCCGLHYAAEREPRSLRGVATARKIRMAAGGGPSVLEAFPRRPAGMSREAYQRMRTKYRAAMPRLARNARWRTEHRRATLGQLGTGSA
jgi:hypothetical protein